MGMFDFITNPINDAFHAVVDSNPITSGISDAIHTVGENTGINDVVDNVAPAAAAAAAIYLTGGALAPEAMASLGGGEAAAGTLAGDAYLPGALASDAGTVAGDAYLPGALANASGDAFLPGALAGDAAANPSLLSQIGSAYSALPSAVQSGLSTAGKTALSKVVGSLFSNGNQGSGALNSSSAGSNSSGGSSASSAVSDPSQSASSSNLGHTSTSPQMLAGAPVYNNNSNILQMLKQLDPQFLAKIAPHMAQQSQSAQPSPATQSIPYNGLMSAMLNKDNLSENLMSARNSLINGGALPGYKSGGHVDNHAPVFITGETGHYVKGRGDGQSDDIPAMLADGEYVFDADTVAQLGNGSSDAGAKLLDHFRESLREHKRSAPAHEIPPEASPLSYMKEALKRHKKG